jgi:hypothetical protein
MSESDYAVLGEPGGMGINITGGGLGGRGGRTYFGGPSTQSRVMGTAFAGSDAIPYGTGGTGAQTSDTGAGGGCGGHTLLKTVRVEPGNVLTITIGSGGTGGTGTYTGGDGADGICIIEFE